MQNKETGLVLVREVMPPSIMARLWAAVDRLHMVLERMEADINAWAERMKGR